MGIPQMIQCPSCGNPVQSDLPFCGKCGTRLTSAASALACSNCGRPNEPGYAFCPACGTRIGPAPEAPKPVSPFALAAKPAAVGAQLLLMDRSGGITQRYPLQNSVTTIGRQGADLNFPDDSYLSPVHAQFVMLDGILSVRDLGSKNGTWLYIEQPHRLVDGDQLLIGSQVLRYRRLGYPGPRPPEQDQTRRLGSLTPNADIANLAQIRADGSPRDIVHLSPGRSIRLGREEGDWQFPYDASMSSLHAMIRSEDADFVVVDQGSRNGVALAVRGERQVVNTSRLLIGDQMLRVEIA
jgi:predicted component of type VI protein secretion system